MANPDERRWIDYADGKRTALKLSQDELAARITALGLPIVQTRWSKWCQGVGIPDVTQLPYIAAALETTVEDLCYNWPGYEGPRPGQGAAPDPARAILEEMVGLLGGPSAAARLLMAALVQGRGEGPAAGADAGGRRLIEGRPTPGGPGGHSARRRPGRPKKRRRPGA